MEQWTDPVLGLITVSPNSRARRIIMRAATDGIRVTAPVFASRSQIEETLVEFRDRLLVKQQHIRSVSRTIDLDYSICTDVVNLRFQEYDKKDFRVLRSNEQVTIFCPVNTDFAPLQERLRKAIIHELRILGMEYLPLRVEALARKHGFRYTSLKIQSSHTRWGSCSSRGGLNLSLFVMLLPSHLIDYIILHELCHTIHHNHSTAFWELLDRVCDSHDSHLLRAELTKYKTDVV